MLINSTLSTTLTMSWMAPSGTALQGMLALACAVQLVQTTCRLKWRPSRFFYLNLAKILAGLPTQKLKLGNTGHPYILYILCRL